MSAMVTYAAASPSAFPPATHLHPSSASISRSEKNTAHQRYHVFRRRPGEQEDSAEVVSREASQAPTSAPSLRNNRWWKIHLFRGMVKDVKRRAPYYWSDWKDAWNYRVVPATVGSSPRQNILIRLTGSQVYMYFAKYAPKSINDNTSMLWVLKMHCD